MREIGEVFEEVGRHADGIVQTDGHGRIVAQAGQLPATEVDAMRIDLLVRSVDRLGAGWRCGECNVVMIMFQGRVLLVAVLPDGGHLTVIAKPEVPPGILLSFMRRVVDGSATATGALQ
ncbi:MAG: hypothetical protein KF901_14035 [Myxococcales bacterium]|nr:hypothetical protein [Myxococcales bacterium]